MVAAGAGVHGRHQREARRVGDAPGRPRQRHLAVLDRLAQRLEHVAAELRQLVEEEHAVVGQRDLAGARRRRPPTSPASETEWCGARKGRAASRPRCARQPGHAVHHGGLQRLVEVERRQEAGQAAGQHGLAAAGRPEEEQVVAARGRHLERPLGHLLPGHVGEVERRRRAAARAAPRAGAAAGAAPRAQATICATWPTAWTVSPSTTAASWPLASGTTRARAPARRAAMATGSTPRTGLTSPESESSPRNWMPSSAAGGSSWLAASRATAMGTSSPAPVLAQVGRRQVHHHPLGGELDAAVADRRQHADPGLGDGAAGQPHQVEAGQAERRLDLDLDREGLDAEDHRGADARQHAPTGEQRACQRESGLNRTGAVRRRGRGTAGQAGARTG